MILCSVDRVSRYIPSQPGQQTVNLNTQQVPIIVYIYSTPPNEGLQICPKHVEVD
jgi:hypothetical protein